MAFKAETRKMQGIGKRASRWKVLLMAAALVAPVGVIGWLVRATNLFRWEPGQPISETRARTIRAAIQNRQGFNGALDCPTIQQLHDDKYLDSVADGVDPWGNAFDLRCTEDEVYVSSRGPDGIRNTADDISVPKTSVLVTPDPAANAGQGQAHLSPDRLGNVDITEQAQGSVVTRSRFQGVTGSTQSR